MSPIRNADPHLIHVRFDLATSPNHEADVELCRANLPQVPNVGEVISLQGNPYVVNARCWSYGEDDALPGVELLWAYLRVMKPHAFNGPRV